MPSTPSTWLRTALRSLAVLGFSLGAAASLRAQAPLPEVHPSYDLVDIRPGDFKPQVTGMQLLPDGRLLVLTHEPVFDKPVVPGHLYALAGVGAGSAAGVTVKLVASNIFCGTGLLVRDGAIFLAEKTRLLQILGLDQGEIVLDAARNEVPGKYRTLHTYGWDGNFHQYAFGPLYRKEADGQGYFYVALSTAWKEDLNKSRNRASLLRISEATGAADTLLSGIRTPNGISFGPEGEIFQVDNQGGWLPSSKMNHLRPGRFYGFKNIAGGLFDAEPPSPPAIWMPHGIISASPADPAYLTQGPYAGQFLIGDVRFGGLQRCFLEKVKGEYQGAIFRFSGGFETAFNQVEIGPDGVIYLGGMGAPASSFWTWPSAQGPRFFALNKLKPNQKPTFDFLAVRTLGPEEIELQFTEPLEASAATPGNYEIRTWTYQPTAAYGGTPVGTAARTISAATLASSGDRVALKVGGLKTGPSGTVVHIRIKSISAKSGRRLWTNEAWYTLNRFGPGDPVPVSVSPSKGDSGRTNLRGQIPAAAWNAGGIRFDSEIEGAWEFELRDAAGKALQTQRGKGRWVRMVAPRASFPPGLYWLILKTVDQRQIHRIIRYP